MGILKLDFESEVRLVRLVAHGGMGSVYRAEQHGAEGFFKTVAVKMIRRRLARDPEFVRRFIAEAKLVADLVHENIVQVYGLNQSAGELFMVMEYVDGVTLEQVIRHSVEERQPVPVELAALVASRACRGLEHAHRKRGDAGDELGIVHRDVSPKNVLLSFEGVVKVTDFGIATARDLAGEAGGAVRGRIEYVAPEQARREPADGRSDLYALGVVTYELLTGEVPHRGAGSLERLHRLGVSYPRPAASVRADLPAELAAIVDRALQPDPQQRFQSALEMGLALEGYLHRRTFGPSSLTLGSYLRERFAPAR